MIRWTYLKTHLHRKYSRKVFITGCISTRFDIWKLHVNLTLKTINKYTVSKSIVYGSALFFHQVLFSSVKLLTNSYIHWVKIGNCATWCIRKVFSWRKLAKLKTVRSIFRSLKVGNYFHKTLYLHVWQGSEYPSYYHLNHFFL